MWLSLALLSIDILVTPFWKEDFKLFIWCSIILQDADLFIFTTTRGYIIPDSDPDGFNISPKEFENSITPNTKAAVLTHLGGHPIDLDPILKIAKSHGIKIVEDCAQASGAMYKGQKAGSIGDIGCHSFYPTKILGAYGDGGFLTTNNKKLY